MLHSKAFIEFSNWDQDLPHLHEIVKKGKFENRFIFNFIEIGTEYLCKIVRFYDNIFLSFKCPLLLCLIPQEMKYFDAR